MWPFSKKAKIERLRKMIEADADLSPEQKETALMRLDDKERSLAGGDATRQFAPTKISDEGERIFDTLLPTIVGKIQLNRLRTRNEMIAEFRKTLDQLSETKKAYARLRDIDAEIAYERMMTYQKGREAQDEHAKKIDGVQRDRDRIQREREQIQERREQEQAAHALKMRELNAKLEEADGKKNTPPASEEDELAKELAKIEREHQIEKARLLKQLEREEIKAEAEQRKKRGGLSPEQFANYLAAKKAIENSGITGKALDQAMHNLRLGFGFKTEEPEEDREY